MSKSYLITGGAGFIGSHLARFLLSKTYDEVEKVVVIDILGYAGSITNLGYALDDPRLEFYRLDIKEEEDLLDFLQRHHFDVIFHLAAHSHVDNSIADPESFIANNILGAQNLAQAAKDYYRTLDIYKKRHFKVINISTDEVYGDYWGKEGPAFEGDAFNPSSPYSASKASADMIFNAYRLTYELPVITLNLCNNFGSHQYPEKLIPLTILKLLNGQSVPVFKDGSQIRQWIYVKDCIQIIYQLALTEQHHSHRYNIGGESYSNLEVIEKIITILKEVCPEASNPAMKSQGEDDYHDLITFVADRKGHDRRYWTADFLLQTTGIRLPIHEFEDNLRETVLWYLENQEAQLSRLKVNSQSGSRINDFFTKGRYKEQKDPRNRKNLRLKA